VTTTGTPSDDDPTESHDSVLIEFTDAHLDLTRRPIRDVVLRNLPAWLREAAEKHRHSALAGGDGNALARCLLEQARLMLTANKFPEAVPKITEAEELFRTGGSPSGLADCLHIAAEIYRGLGEIDRALDYLRKEEEIRRRMAA
jgi:tetratricopeptide (TPR) repeat protein